MCAFIGVDRFKVNRHAALYDIPRALPLPPAPSRDVRAMVRALPQLLRLINEIFSGGQLPSSSSRPTRSMPLKIFSVCISASFSWISWLAVMVS